MLTSENEKVFAITLITLVAVTAQCDQQRYMRFVGRLFSESHAPVSGRTDVRDETSVHKGKR